MSDQQLRDVDREAAHDAHAEFEEKGDVNTKLEALPLSMTHYVASKVAPRETSRKATSKKVDGPATGTPLVKTSCMAKFV